MQDLSVTDGALAGAWIEPRLGGQFGAVTLQVPKGFEAYARVFHPAWDSAGNPVTWAEVAKVCGTTPHPEMQWHAILGPGDGSGVKWAGQDPSIGEMDVQTLDALCEVLVSHTNDPTRCLFGLCEIQGWLDSLSTTHVPSLLELPMGRNYAILTGPLSAIDQITRDWANAAPLRQREAPNLIWPPDHSWFVASEVDFDSTLIGGSATLIDAIVDSPALEAMPVEESTSLAYDADTINGPTLPET